MNGMAGLEELEKRLARVESRLQLGLRTDPAIALATDLHSLGHVPAVRVYRDSAQTIPNDTNTGITFNLERFDNDEIHSTTALTGRLYAVVSGVYLIIGQVPWTANATGRRIVWVLLNSTTNIGEHSLSPGTFAMVMPVVTLYSLTAGDYVDLFVKQISGGNLDVLTGSEFMMAKVAEVGQL